ncbi:hypothetical protein COPCOM_00271 [Coprococcus comes ATCC 27758]|uniref:Uncharacterized protein n=1 Tax=Coprococcus comes ATCC 27758 TaxID=470146 RepID=C0B551_9FIRM|nr:hypothetical protein COPCOM_00271 [Coprococcus comes ATCC 27758]
MSSDIEKEPLSRQQKKSKETKARIFHAAKTILQKQGYDQLSIKISVMKQVSPTAASIIILKPKMIFYLIILKNSQASIRIFWIRRKMQMRQRSVSSTFI